MGCPFNFVVSPPDVNSALLSGQCSGDRRAAVPAGHSPAGSCPSVWVGLPVLHWHILLQLQRKIRYKYISCLECGAI